MLLNPEKTDEVMKMVAEGHIRDHADAVTHTKLFFDSLLWALETSFGPDWMSGEKESPEAMAWTRLIHDLRKRSVILVKSILKQQITAAEAELALLESEGEEDEDDVSVPHHPSTTTSHNNNHGSMLTMPINASV